MRQLHFQPIAGKALDIVGAILRTPEVASCKEALGDLRMACEELVVNVVDYAYPGRTDGYLNVEIAKDGHAVTIRLRDGGVAFNPLEAVMPDITKPLEERRIGGLGIFIVLRKMDSVSYERTDNENILTIKKWL